METFTKLFGSIVHSTIWREPDHVRLVWLTMLALSDRDGKVWASLPGLADAARVSIDSCEDALDRLQKPDRYSRSPAHEGRRVIAIDRGWEILNYAEYRQRGKEEAHRQANRRYYEKKKSESDKKNPNRMSRRKTGDIADADADTDADADAETESNYRPPCAPRGGSKKKVALPPDWQPKPSHAEVAAKLGRDLTREAEDFRLACEAKGYKYASHDAAFHRWLRNESYRRPPDATVSRQTGVRGVGKVI